MTPLVAIVLKHIGFRDISSRFTKYGSVIVVKDKISFDILMNDGIRALGY